MPSSSPLLGGALFHMLPEGTAALDHRIVGWVWVAVGFLMFMALEQVLEWYHCHRVPSEHRRTVSWLVLVADAAHNYLGGLAVGGGFLVDLRVGAVAWLAAAAHEIPQELGDFGVLVHGGWAPKKALLFNVLSALTFPLGGLLAWAMSGAIDVAFLLLVGAGNFLYIAAADLVPEVRGCAPDARGPDFGPVLWYALGAGALLGVRLVFAGP